MITFKSFLLNEQQEMTFTFEEGLKAIKENCSWFLNESRGKPLFRGTSNWHYDLYYDTYTSNKLIALKLHPTNRKPRDSSPVFNFVFNSMLDAAYGIQNIRKKSFFATGNKLMASVYGYTMFCFPKGKLEWVWSPDIADSLEQSNDIYDELIKKYNLDKSNLDKLYTIFYLMDKKYKSNASRWIENLTGDANEITDEIIKNSKLKDSFLKSDTTPYEVLRRGLKETGEKLYISNDGLSRAISSGNEILFYKSGGYYLIPVQTVVQKIQNDNKNNGIQKLEIPTIYEYILSKL